MTDKSLRKSATGEPGNKGEFGSKTNSDGTIELPDTTPPNATCKSVLAAANKVGASKATDAQAMALFIENDLQILCGAVSKELVWAGARKSGLTFRELAELASTNPRAVEDLMWL